MITVAWRGGGGAHGHQACPVGGGTVPPSGAGRLWGAGRAPATPRACQGADGAAAAKGKGAEPARARVHRLTRPQAIRLMIGLAMAGGLLFAVFAAAGGVPAELAQLRRTQLAWLGPAVAAEAVSYALFGMQLRRLGGGGPRLGWGVWTRIALIVYGLGRLTPAAPAEGAIYSAFQLRRRGMGKRRAGLVLVLGLWTQFWALVLVFAADRVAAVGLAHLSMADAAPFAVSVLMAGATVVAVTALRRRAAIDRITGLLAFLPGRWRRSRVQLRAIGESWHHDIEELLGPPRAWSVVLLVAMGGWVADAACLWLALLSAHAHPGFEVVILAYALASFAAWLPLLPAGAGVVETVAPAVLHHFGVPLLAALAATLIWRAMSLLLPAVAGLAAGLTLQAARPGGAPVHPGGLT